MHELLNSPSVLSSPVEVFNKIMICLKFFLHILEYPVFTAELLFLEIHKKLQSITFII